MIPVVYFGISREIPIPAPVISFFFITVELSLNSSRPLFPLLSGERLDCFPKTVNQISSTEEGLALLPGVGWGGWSEARWETLL